MEAVGVIVNKTGEIITIEKKEGEDGEVNNSSNAADTTPNPEEIHHEDEVEDMSENESEGTQPEEVCFEEIFNYILVLNCYKIVKI